MQKGSHTFSSHGYEKRLRACCSEPHSFVPQCSINCLLLMQGHCIHSCIILSCSTEDTRAIYALSPKLQAKLDLLSLVPAADSGSISAATQGMVSPEVFPMGTLQTATKNRGLPLVLPHSAVLTYFRKAASPFCGPFHPFSTQEISSEDTRL